MKDKWKYPKDKKKNANKNVQGKINFPSAYANGT